MKGLFGVFNPREIQDTKNIIASRNERDLNYYASKPLPESFDVVIYSDSAEPGQTATSTTGNSNPRHPSNFKWYRVKSLAGHNDMLPEPSDSAGNVREANIQTFFQGYYPLNEAQLPQDGDVWSAILEGGNLVRLDKYIRGGESTKSSSAAATGETPSGEASSAINNSNNTTTLGQVPTTEIPALTGDIKPIKTWVATESPKEDGTFSKGECPDSLTGAYSSLPRKVTTFYSYTREDVIKSIAKTGQPAYVQRTMYAYIKKEQPNFRFPNNNVAGIQTDGGMFAGTTIADYDYQTCFKDAVTWRAFAGFNSLERGMKTFGAQIAGKYSKKFRIPSGTYEEQADTLVWNYYRGWNLAATPEELETLKKTGSFTRKGKTYTKNWTQTVTYFAKFMKEFDDSVVSLK